VKKKKIYRQNIFLQVLSFIASKNNWFCSLGSKKFIKIIKQKDVQNSHAAATPLDNSTKTAPIARIGFQWRSYLKKEGAQGDAGIGSNGPVSEIHPLAVSSFCHP
jgi:hypothetical protein